MKTWVRILSTREVSLDQDGSLEVGLAQKTSRRRPGRGPNSEKASWLRWIVEKKAMAGQLTNPRHPAQEGQEGICTGEWLVNEIRGFCGVGCPRL